MKSLFYLYVFKVGLSSTKKMCYLLHWKPFKNDEKCFVFHLKSSFCLFIYFYFIYSWLKITHLHKKKSLYSLYSNNIELTDVNSVTEQKMQSFPKEFLKSMWTNWQTHTHLFTHSSKKHAREHLHSCVVSFLVFTV